MLDIAADRDGPEPSRGTVPVLYVTLLGGFRVERSGIQVGDAAWQQRRTAKTLIKLLATEPGHSLHREQILEILWQEVDVESALNSFGKALHAARHALEPELRPRENSAYLQLGDDVLRLDTERVVVDVDRFQQLAETALRQRDVAGYETALAVYTGELLPEDRYDDWSAERRNFLADLYVRLLLGLADALEKHGARGEVRDRLRQVIQQDPTREDVHRRLMRLYAEMGSRHEAVRQYQICREVLHKELDVTPEGETDALHRDILENRIQKRVAAAEQDLEAANFRPFIMTAQLRATPLVGQVEVLQMLREELERTQEGTGAMVLVSGEASVGKTRVAAELAIEASRRRMLVLWGTSEAHENHVPYGSFVLALESYVASLPVSERTELCGRYPELSHLVPSLKAGQQPPPTRAGTGDDSLHVFSAIARLLTDLASTRPVLVVVDDLQAAHSSTIHLLQYLALVPLATRRRWFVLATSRDEALGDGSELQRMVQLTMQQRRCRHVALQRLGRQDADQLVQALLPAGAPDESLLEHIFNRSLGNPLFVEEIVRAMQERNELVLSGGHWYASDSLSDRVPGRVRALVDVSMAHMGEGVRRVVALAAVAGTEFTLRQLHTGASALQPPIPSTALLDALDLALKSGILEERVDAYAFRHPLVRDALYESLSAHRRAQFRGALDPSAPPALRIAEPPAELGDGARPVQAHFDAFEQVMDRGQELPARLTAEAYGELVDWLERIGRRLESAIARQKLAVALVAMGKYERALHVLMQAAETYTSLADHGGMERVAAQIRHVSLLHQAQVPVDHSTLES